MAEIHLAKGGVDIVPLDMGLPDGHGLDTVRRAHRVAQSSTTNMTVYNNEANRVAIGLVRSLDHNSGGLLVGIQERARLYRAILD